MKKTMTGVLVLALTLSLSIIAFASNGEKTAKPSQTKFIMDGKEVAFDVAYNIEDSNYIQLRSVAQTLSGTKSQFNVYWDNDLHQAVIETGKPYTGVVSSAEKPNQTEENTPTNVPQSYKIGDTISMENATLSVTDVKTSTSTPPDEYGSRFIASNGHVFLCISFEVTANSLNYNNTLWQPPQFIRYATAASGVNYQMPFSQGTAGFGANEKKSVTVYIEVPDSETIATIVISDGAYDSATISIEN